MYLCPEQAKEFKEEIRTHLVETVKELQTQGKSEEESVDIAIKRFGEEKQLNIEFRKVFKFQKKFKKALVFHLYGIFIYVDDILCSPDGGRR
jgi:uncharacterized protein YpuA (DUF1002 family)